MKPGSKADAGTILQYHLCQLGDSHISSVGYQEEPGSGLKACVLLIKRRKEETFQMLVGERRDRVRECEVTQGFACRVQLGFD